jgi:tetratricopeptide (TPR) repeat protein
MGNDRLKSNLERFLSSALLIALASAVSIGQTRPCERSQDILAEIEKATSILTNDPNNVAALVKRGVAFQAAGNVGLSRKDLDRAIELEPTSAEAFVGRGRLRSMVGQYELAVSDFSRAISLDQKSANTYFDRARTYQEWDKLELALSDYRRTLDLDEDSVEAHAGIGSVYVRLRDNDLGALWLNRAIEMLDRRESQPEPTNCKSYLQHLRGYIALSAKRYNDAFRDLNSAAKLDADSSEILYYRATVYRAINALDSALVDMNRAIELLPVRAEYYNFRARLYDRLNDKKAAEIDREKLLILTSGK